MKNASKKVLLILVLALLVAGGVFAQNRSTPNPDSDFVFDAGTIVLYIGKDNRCVVPSRIDGRAVTAIGDKAFTGSDIVTEVVLPSSVTSVGEYAFALSTLRYITVQGTLRSIGNSAFMKTNLQSFISNWPRGITKIPNNLFWDSQLSRALAIPEGVTEIGEFAFSGTKITSVTLPRTIRTIRDQAFYNCGSLTTVTIPSSVTRITVGNNAFNGTRLNAESRKALTDRGAAAGSF